MMEQDMQDKLDRARTMATDNVKRATEGLKQGAERIGERARAAGATAGENIGKAKEQAGKAADQANRIITEHPLAAAAAAVAVGALVAYVFPKSSRKARDAAPKLLAAAGSAGQKARQSLVGQAKDKLPLDQADQLLEKIGDAVRKAPSTAATAAQAGLESAKSGIETARSFAADAARKADIEERAGKWLDTASEVAAKMAAKVRDHARGESEKKED